MTEKTYTIGNQKLTETDVKNLWAQVEEEEEEDYQEALKKWDGFCDSDLWDLVEEEHQKRLYKAYEEGGKMK